MSTHLETTTTRTNNAGLEVTAKVGYSDYGDYDGFTESERTEAFVVRFKRNVSLPGGHSVARKGQLAFVWRTAYGASDFDFPHDGSVSINGFREDGRQTLSWNSDADAARDIESVRDSEGKIQRALDHPRYAEAERQYGYMMSY